MKQKVSKPRKGLTQNDHDLQMIAKALIDLIMLDRELELQKIDLLK